MGFMQIPVSGFRVVDRELEPIAPRTQDEVVAAIESPEFVWLDFDLESAPVQEVVELLEKRLDFHPLTVEECVTPDIYQPKMEEESGYHFFIFHYFSESRRDYLKPSEINIYLGKNFVLTVHRKPIPRYLKQFMADIPEDLFLFDDRSIIFFYHILDVLIDDYLRLLVVIENRGDEIEFKFLSGKEVRVPLLRLRFVQRPGISTMEDVIAQRQNLLIMRKSVLEELKILNELTDSYEKPEEPLDMREEEREEIVVYLGTLANHLEQALHVIEREREALTQNLELQNLVINLRSQEIMTVLTLVMAIFVPITFITGFYGMNLPNLHGTGLGHSLYTIWVLDGIMLGIVGWFIYYFYRKGWL